MGSYKVFPTHGSTVLEEVQDVFRYAQANDGWFFGNPDNIDDGRALKEAARKDKGLPVEPLISVKQYFQKHFAYPN